MRFAYLTRELVIKNQSKLSCQAQTKSLHIAKQKLLFLCFYSTNLNLFQLTRQSKNLKCLSILKDWSSLFNIVRNLVSQFLTSWSIITGIPFVTCLVGHKASCQSFQEVQSNFYSVGGCGYICSCLNLSWNHKTLQSLNLLSLP